MGFSPEFRAYVEERLSAVAPIRTKAMFGGLGIYGKDLFFALVDEDKLYFKVSELNQADFEAAGMEPFVPWPGAAPMGYWEVPPKVLENDAELQVWADKALAVAEAAKKPRARKK
jgi:DNA transformation protein and related proteins